MNLHIQVVTGLVRVIKIHYEAKSNGEEIDIVSVLDKIELNGIDVDALKHLREFLNTSISWIPGNDFVRIVAGEHWLA